MYTYVDNEKKNENDRISLALPIAIPIFKSPLKFKLEIVTHIKLEIVTHIYKVGQTT